MIAISTPIFLVIFCGYFFGRIKLFSAEAEKLINEYVLYVALPALLFLAVARAEPSDLANWAFVIATLAGIFCVYILAVIYAQIKGVAAPQSSLVGMASSYGTTGYMGIPIAIAAFGEQAAVPAAIATILHNIPVILTVTSSHVIARESGAGVIRGVVRALASIFKNPLTIAVLLGFLVSYFGLSLPSTFESFCNFLAPAAGPTALFALGLGLARIRFEWSTFANKISWIMPIIVLKILLQPLVTFIVLFYIFGAGMDVWFATAMVMAAQPVGAGAYVFAKNYDFFDEEVSLAIIVSVLIALVTMPILLEVLSG